MLSSTCAVYGSRKLRFLKGKEANELLSSLGIKHFQVKFPYWVLFYVKGIKLMK